jgi:hypothetical protein
MCETIASNSGFKNLQEMKQILKESFDEQSFVLFHVEGTKNSKGKSLH